MQTAYQSRSLQLWYGVRTPMYYSSRILSRTFLEYWDKILPHGLIDCFSRTHRVPECLWSSIRTTRCHNIDGIRTTDLTGFIFTAIVWRPQAKITREKYFKSIEKFFSSFHPALQLNRAFFDRESNFEETVSALYVSRRCWALFSKQNSKPVLNFFQLSWLFLIPEEEIISCF